MALELKFKGRPGRRHEQRGTAGNKFKRNNCGDKEQITLLPLINQYEEKMERTAGGGI
jgi:hypothetical protein